ncbi:hypothetical protein MAM1_0214d08129 [Mucor ambiguus]|uniref:Uncharacterized protein n=1 Tax=Mucor ambiguus TaxID=91626 RepID=A0A0C9MM78_9FUNG|nr:hypothetical protein MAM1_0214d08129 [Mucor ambiguus]
MKFMYLADNQSQDGAFLQSSISFYNQQQINHTDDNHENMIINNNMNNGNQVKRFRASSASLYQLQQQQQPNSERQIRRTSYMKPLKRIDPDSSFMPINTSVKLSQDMAVEAQQYSIRKMPSSIGTTSKLPTSGLPTRKQSCIDISNTSNNRITPPPAPPRLKKTKSNQSLMSTSTTTSVGSRPSMEYNNSKSNSNSSRLRQPSPAISHTKLLVRSESNSSLHQHVNKKKSLPKIPPPPSSTTNSSSGNDEDDETKSFLTRTSSNGSTATIDKRGSRRKSSLVEKRKKSTAAVNDQCGDNFVMDMLRDELEREKSSTKALQGQKDAISKDLDYFCKLVDEVTEEKDEYKRKYEEEKDQNKQLKKTIRDLESTASSSSSMISRDCSGGPIAQLQTELQNLQQQTTDEQYAYYSNLQYKNEEINVLKTELKQAQRQIQVLRKTMEQMLKAEGGGNDDFEPRKSFVATELGTAKGDHKCLLLQTGYHPDHSNSTSPPSPLPCYHNELHDDDVLSISSKDSYHSNKSHHQLKLQYEFLKYDDHDNHQMSSLAKRRSEDFSKKIAMSRRRKDQLEEMLGEVDTQLNRVKQKIRPSP